MKKRLILRNALLIDGTGGPPVNGATVVIAGNNISDVLPTGEDIVEEEHDEVIDLQGMSLLPGIIDTHVHLTIPPLTDKRNYDSEMLKTIHAVSALQSCLQAGITTVRDLGGPRQICVNVQEVIRADLVRGPRVIWAGSCLTSKGGHGNLFGYQVSNPAEACEKVARLVEEGSQWIKVMVTAGIGTPHQEPETRQLSVDTVAAIVKEAHRRGLKVAAHVQGAEGIDCSLRAGIDTIEHGIGIDAAAAREMAKRGVWLVPTLSAIECMLAAGTKGELPCYMVERAKRLRPIQLTSLALALEAGVPVAMGSDCSTPLNQCGDNLRELELMVKAGITPLDAIYMSTGAAAKLLGMEQTIGTIEAGKSADLLVVRGDPTKDISVVHNNLCLVFKDGQISRGAFNGL